MDLSVYCFRVPDTNGLTEVKNRKTDNLSYINL